MRQRFKYPWTHVTLAALSLAFMAAATYQIFVGAGRVFWAAHVAGEILAAEPSTLGQLDEISLKRAVQSAYRSGGLYVPMEDVILSSPTKPDDANHSANQRVVGRRNASVWLAVPFRVPWIGTFVYGISREYLFESSSGRDQ